MRSLQLLSLLPIQLSRASKLNHFSKVHCTGAEQWGKSENLRLPQFLTNNPLPNGFPWGSRTANSDPNDIPSTGVTRHYNFNVTRGKASPDGYEKDVIVVNDQFPGPLIEANWGDWIEVTVNNQIAYPTEGTSIHWHGFAQKDTPWYDGVSGITQCPIAPGTSLTYTFRADIFGTTWYHAHFSSQYSQGLSGPIVIYGPRHVPYDIDLGPIMVSDHYHRNYSHIDADAAASTNDFTVYVPASDNNIINGKMNFNCSLSTTTNKCVPNAPLAKFHLQRGKTHLLRVINSGSAAMQRFSIDGHKLTIISNDFTPIVPYETEILNIGVGQRSDVLVAALDDPSPLYWMRSTLAANCTRTLNLFAKAIVQYEHVAEGTLPTSTPYSLPEKHCGNDPLNETVPLFPIPANLSPDITVVIELDLFTNATGSHIWIMNNETFGHSDYNNPLLFLEQSESYTSPADQMVVDFGNKTSARIVINNKYQAAHPMHLHGANFMVLSDGQGYWDGKTIINPENPQRRDTQMLRRYGHMVIQVESLNPGVWPFHCHIAWHASTGLYLNFLQQREELQKLKVPAGVTGSCDAWKAYAERDPANEIDSGL